MDGAEPIGRTARDWLGVWTLPALIGVHKKIEVVAEGFEVDDPHDALLCFVAVG
jgi:hypothetical protein